VRRGEGGNEAGRSRPAKRALPRRYRPVDGKVSSFDGENNPYETVGETRFVLYRLSVQRGVARETVGHNKEDQVACTHTNCSDQVVLTSLR